MFFKNYLDLYTLVLLRTLHVYRMLHYSIIKQSLNTVLPSDFQEGGTSRIIS